MAIKKNQEQKKDQILSRHTGEEGRDQFKTKGTGIPGRETL